MTEYNLSLWFPVAIYGASEIISVEENTKIYNRGLELQTSDGYVHDEWVGNTCTTYENYVVHHDKIFQPLMEQIKFHVRKFAEMHNSTDEPNLNASWLNVNTEGTHQEFHTHNGNIFSCVYWVKAPTGSGNLIFEDPKCPDMLPIRKLKGENDLNRQRICYAAVERRLVIFRSYLRHMVEPCKNKLPRMSIAVNFN